MYVCVALSRVWNHERMAKPEDTDGTQSGRPPLDVTEIIRVASNGFLLLIIAEGIGLLLGGGILVPVATAAVYVYVGRKAARGRHRPVAHGAWAAALSYLLIVPLRVLIAVNAPESFDAPPIGRVLAESSLSLVLAVVVGGFAGRIQGTADGQRPAD